MNHILKQIIPIAVFLLLVGCTTTKKDNTTYFGGKIINPKSDYVLLYQQESIIDSLVLDENDTFLGKYKDFKEGFYYFKHGPEYQHIYIQPQDSILIRLNTWDFDETLVFSGIGAKKNNILIDCFLEGERESKNHDIYAFYFLEANKFKEKMDSMLASRQKKIDDFKSNNSDLPKGYNLILDIVSKYPLYKRFENYPEVYRKSHKSDHFPKTDSLFYNFRKNINMNNDSLMYIGAYSKYVVNRLYNNVYNNKENIQSNEFIIPLLTTVNENIKGEKLRNTLLYRMILNDFLDKSTCGINKKAFHTYFQLSTNIEDKKSIQRLINDVNTTHGSDPVPNFNVFNYNKTKINIKELIKRKNSVIYFWNPKHISRAYLASRINLLQRKFPKLNFIGINISKNHKKPIKAIDIKSQYYIDSNSKANNFLTSRLPRTLLVNKKGIIVNGYVSLNSSKVYKQLKYLQKH